jgi:hypothetical protein
MLKLDYFIIVIRRQLYWYLSQNRLVSSRFALYCWHRIVS